MIPAAPAFPLAASALAAFSQMGSTAINALFARREAAQQRKYNRREMERMLQYNHPTQQMERLREAGLNPMLAYGELSSAQQQAPIEQPAALPPVIDPSQVLQQFFDIAGQGAAIKYQLRATQAKNFTMWKDISQRTLMISQRRLNEIQHEFLSDTMEDRIDTAQAHRIKAEIEAAIKRKHNEWWQNGINPSDNTWLRISIEYLKFLKQDTEELEKLLRHLFTSPTGRTAYPGFLE